MKSFLLILTLAALSLNGCAQSIQTEESQDSGTSDSINTVDTEITETNFLPENEGWSEFKNENITFSYPEGFTVTEQGENVYLTNSDSSSSLGMAQGEIWISFSPTTKDAEDSEGPSESIADSNVATNGTDSWYKIELLMGGNGQATTEAEDIFEKVESTFQVL